MKFPIRWDKARQERIIADSDVEWVIVRPGVLTNGDRRGRVRHGHRVGGFLWTARISRADVADFMLNQLESDTYLRAGGEVVEAVKGDSMKKAKKEMRMGYQKSRFIITSWAGRNEG